MAICPIDGRPCGLEGGGRCAIPCAPRHVGPKGELARYAYGFSNRKPGWSFWIIIAGMVAFVLYNAIRIV